MELLGEQLPLALTHSHNLSPGYLSFSLTHTQILSLPVLRYLWWDDRRGEELPVADAGEVKVKDDGVVHRQPHQHADQVVLPEPNPWLLDIYIDVASLSDKRRKMRSKFQRCATQNEIPYFVVCVP